jgi:hypothetical protein
VRRLWQKFLRTFDDAETAGVALLIAVGSLIASVALFVHWLAVGKYAAVLGLAAALAMATGVCVRDFRRERWSVLSAALIATWILLTISALVFTIWFEHEKG